MKLINSISGKRWYIFGVMICLIFILTLNDVDSGVASGYKRNIPDNMYGVSINKDGVAVAVGYHGSFFTSHDSGETWKRNKVTTSELLRRVDIDESTTVLAVGNRGGIYRSKTVDDNLEKVFDAPNGYLRDIKFVGNNVAIAVGKEGSIYRSTDNGQSWEKRELQGVTTRDKPTLNGVSTIGETRVLVSVGEFGVVFLSEDMGLTWVNVKSKLDKSLTSVDTCKGCDYAVAVGLDGIVVTIKYSNFKVVVKRIESGTENHFFDLAIVDKKIIAVGDSSIINISPKDIESKFYRNKGYDSNYSWLHGVAVAPDGDVIAVGRRGDMVRGDNLGFPNDYNNFSTIN